MEKELEQERRKREMENNAYLRLNHISIQSISPDQVVLTAELLPELTNPYGMAHGGLLFTMGDCCAGMTARGDGRKYVTLNAEMQYLSNVDHGTLTARSHVIRRGRSICVVGVRICDEEDRPLTEGTFTMYCVSGEK